MADVAFSPDFAHLQPLRERYLATWGTHVAALLERAPARTDLAIPYFIWLLESGREEALLDVTERILALNPRDPAGLWFSGIVLAGRPSTVEVGLTRMRQSLAEGIERFMPVDANIQEALRR